jgi:hypothetical protein
MSTSQPQILNLKVTYYAPHEPRAVHALKELSTVLPPTEIRSSSRLPLDGPAGFFLEYHSRMKVAESFLTWSIYACDGVPTSELSRTVAFKNATAILLRVRHDASRIEDVLADVKALQDMVAESFGRRVGGDVGLVLWTLPSQCALAVSLHAMGYDVAIERRPHQGLVVFRELMRSAVKTAAKVDRAAAAAREEWQSQSSLPLPRQRTGLGFAWRKTAQAAPPL